MLDEPQSEMTHLNLTLTLTPDTAFFLGRDLSEGNGNLVSLCVCLDEARLNPVRKTEEKSAAKEKMYMGVNAIALLVWDFFIFYFF